MTDLQPITPEPKAHIAVCPGCENASLARDVCHESTMMQCPRCGTVIRPTDISLYELSEVDDGR